jgi:hypothetical protein
MPVKKSNVVNINWIDRSEQYALVPGYTNYKKSRKLKSLPKSKGNCYFTSGISFSLIDFIYRAVVQLKLKDKKMLFSRGSVKIKGKPVIYAVGIRELEWDVGMSIRIPNKLKYNSTIKISVEKEEYEIRIMEMIVLSALLHIANMKKPSRWCSETAVSIIAKGWQQLAD